jgi:hypothetical protein
MIRHLVFKTLPAEPPVGQVEVDLFAQPAFRADSKAVTDDQHPDYQFRINGRTSGMAVEIRQILPEIAQIQLTIDAAQKMIFGDVVFEVEGIKQVFLAILLMSHHGENAP